MTLVRVVGVVALFALVLALTFPTDALVRAAILRYTPPGSPILVFERAHLRPWGLVLDQVTLRRPDGTAVTSVDWLSARPSWLGFVHDRTGRPWHVGIGGCSGTLDAVFDRDGTDTDLALGWKDLDLGNCPALPKFDFTFAGVAEGTGKLRRTPTGPVGEGDLRLRAAAFRVPGRGIPGLDTLHADPGSLHWALDGTNLRLTGIDVRGPEVNATGAGTVHLAANLAHSAIDFAFAMKPGTVPNPILLAILNSLPPASGDAGARRLVLTGTFDAPQVAH